MKGGFFPRLYPGTLFKGPTGTIVVITKLNSKLVWLQNIGATDSGYTIPRYMFRALYWQK